MPSGSCLCGEVAYEFTGEPSLKVLCHCRDCQQWCGAVASSNMIIPRDQFKVTQGSPKKFGLKGDSGKTNTRAFCGNCGSSLFSELEAKPDVIALKAGGLINGDADYKTVQAEFYVKDRVSFAPAIEGAEQKETM